MSAQPISVSDKRVTAMRAALNAGWRRRDVIWERWQEAANRALAEGRGRAARWGFIRAGWLARLGFAQSDPRRAASEANLALAARLAGREPRARRLYARARTLWAGVPEQIAGLEVKPRSRSSLFHLRMEARHRETFRANLDTRLGRFVAETDEALAALAESQPVPHRLYPRWKGEKPAIHDDTRKLLAACLLIGVPSD
ncbi:tetratricopeptide repeat protein [Maritimibacter sp. 55A14]|uniref:tetratricopeptide repeat protein n=1 Tax=Maritimibacter sp. 55A14 TaxID=2174844 RepID=UPI000D6178D8|nr:tetratricopeptide repeat protein [Maritimibacter sp. 55A14]PWE34150.1 tetratricopeptide repeat protein [Maritimibacter sp. 55A14]